LLGKHIAMFTERFAVKDDRGSPREVRITLVAPGRSEKRSGRPEMRYPLPVGPVPQTAPILAADKSGAMQHIPPEAPEVKSDDV